MKCQRCGQHDASVHYIEIVGDEKTNLWICEECARKEGISAENEADLDSNDAKETGDASSSGLEVFLGGMLQAAEDEADGGVVPPQTLVCPGCGYEESQLQTTGLLGCPQCYTTFRRRIVPLLRRYHREVHHLGKVPQAQGPRAALRREVAALKAALEEAVAREEYERAAEIRDEIQAKEQAQAAARDTAPPADDSDTEE